MQLSTMIDNDDSELTGDKNMSEETQYPGDTVRKLMHEVSLGIDERLAYYRRGTDYANVRPSDVRLFSQAARHPQTIAELARKLGISRQAAHMCVKRLIKTRTVKLESPPHNNREKLVILTERGKAARQLAIQYINRLDADLAKIIGPDGLEDFKSKLTHIRDHFVKSGEVSAIRNDDNEDLDDDHSHAASMHSGDAHDEA